MMSAFCTLRSATLPSIFVERPVADPPLLPVEHPVVAVAPGRGREAAGDVRAVLRLGQREGPDRGEVGHAGQPAVPLLRRSAVVDAPERQPRVDAEEGPERRVDPRQLQRCEAAEQPGERRVAEALVGAANDVEVAQRRDEVARELRLRPVLVRDRANLALEELAQPEDLLLLVVGQEGLVCVEVTAVRLQGAHAATVCRAAPVSRRGHIPGRMPCSVADATHPVIRPGM
jgi:hypothetical protein